MACTAEPKQANHGLEWLNLAKFIPLLVMKQLLQVEPQIWVANLDIATNHGS